MIARTLAIVAVACWLSACGGPQSGGGDEPDRHATAEQLLRQAQDAEKAGQPNVANKKYERALRLRPNHLPTTERYVQFLIDQRRRDEAIALARRFVEANPGATTGYHILADAQIADRLYRAALTTLAELISLDEADPSAHEKRGRVYVLAGNVAAGIADLRRAAELAPDDPELLVSLGSALHRSGNIDAAVGKLKRALRHDPDNARGHLILGIVRRKQFELQEALNEHLKAARLAPQDARTHFELGITQNANGDDLAAERSLARAVDLDPDSATNWYAYGDVLRLLKRYQEAVPAYRRALELDPDHPKAANKLGLALYYIGDYPRAEVVLTDSIRRNRNNPYPYFNLGIVYAKQNKRGLAIGAFERFLQLAPPEDGDREAAEAKLRALRGRK